MATPKDPKQFAKSNRLMKAVEEARAGFRLQTAAPVASKLAKAPNKSKFPSRIIKYPNVAGALRQYVSQAQEDATPRPNIRLRLPPQVGSTGGGLVKPVRADSPVNPQQSAAERKTEIASGSKPRVAHLSGATSILAPADLGQIVRRTRKRRRLTQTQLAALAGTGRRFISELESGKSTLEFGRVLMACSALGVQLLAVGPTDEQ